ncbi:MAG: DUF2059 domain-containing protein [Acidobacteriota bacterium]|jgi:hypothetical protein|nr:DUF2059 domain-containing protein [Acidobacteriota bacterium]
MYRNLLSVLSVVVVLALGGCSQPAPITDSPEARLEQARALTALEVKSGALDDMLDEGAALAREATADMLMFELEREPSAEDLAQLEAVMRAGLAEFLTAELWQETVAAVYAENFTAAELQETVAFYTSPTGRKILGLGRPLDEAVGEAVETALEVHSDEFAARVDAALAETFPEFAEGDS